MCGLPVVQAGEDDGWTSVVTVVRGREAFGEFNPCYKLLNKERRVRLFSMSSRQGNKSEDPNTLSKVIEPVEWI